MKWTRKIVCCNPGMLSVIHIQVETPTMALNIPQTWQLCSIKCFSGEFLRFSKNTQNPTKAVLKTFSVFYTCSSVSGILWNNNIV